MVLTGALGQARSRGAGAVSAAGGRGKAERYAVPVVGSEIVGLIPKKAVEMSAEYFLRFENFSPALIRNLEEYWIRRRPAE